VGNAAEHVVAVNKKYQVFVSSTFRDLQDARAEVFRTIYEMDCVVAGMELFPAIDEEQFEFIKRIIDDSDYYVILVGNRYGTTSPSGLSFTELEYEYAVEKGIKVVALLHDDPLSLSVDKSETDPKLVEKLEAFRKRLRTGRLVRTWSKPSDLPGIVAVALQKTMTTHPARGWVRGDTVPGDEIIVELNTLRAERESLRSRLATTEQELAGLKAQSDPPTVEHLKAALLSKIALTLEVREKGSDQVIQLEVELGSLFEKAQLPLFGSSRHAEVGWSIERWLKTDRGYEKASLSKGSLDLLAYVLEKVGLIRVTTDFEERERVNWRAAYISNDRRPIEKVKESVSFWQVTPLGRDALAARYVPMGFAPVRN
jgi:hypothetical protein